MRQGAGVLCVWAQPGSQGLRPRLLRHARQPVSLAGRWGMAAACITYRPRASSAEENSESTSSTDRSFFSFKTLNKANPAGVSNSNNMAKREWLGESSRTTLCGARQQTNSTALQLTVVINGQDYRETEDLCWRGSKQSLTGTASVEKTARQFGCAMCRAAGPASF